MPNRLRQIPEAIASAAAYAWPGLIIAVAIFALT
jgi:hypothetical protein